MSCTHIVDFTNRAPATSVVHDHTCTPAAAIASPATAAIPFSKYLDCRQGWVPGLKLLLAGAASPNNNPAAAAAAPMVDAGVVGCQV
jgi:hypothetical protein